MACVSPRARKPTADINNVVTRDVQQRFKKVFPCPELHCFATDRQTLAKRDKEIYFRSLRCDDVAMLRGTLQTTTSHFLSPCPSSTSSYLVCSALKFALVSENKIAFLLLNKKSAWESFPNLIPNFISATHTNTPSIATPLIHHPFTWPCRSQFIL